MLFESAHLLINFQITLGILLYYIYSYTYHTDMKSSDYGRINGKNNFHAFHTNQY